MKRAAICEFGDSHDDIFYAQFEFLKKSGFETFFIGHRIFEGRLVLHDNIDHAFFLDIGKSGVSDFLQIYKTWQFINKHNITNVILNTIEGTHVRNFCLFPFGNRLVTGIIHNAGNLVSDSFTYNKIIKPKINRMFALNAYIQSSIGTKITHISDWVYPLAMPKYNKLAVKKEGEFNAVVPGLVEHSRRDYHFLIRSLLNADLPENLKIILLGKSMHGKGLGREIKEAVKDSPLKEKLVMFDDFVDWDTFRSYVDSADLLLPLLHPGYRNFNSYTATKITGTYLLSFAHKVPLFSHEYFDRNDDIGNSSLFYNPENFTRKLCELALNRSQIYEVKQKMANNPNFEFEFNRKKYISHLR
jgi:hypothetical protein